MTTHDRLAGERFMLRPFAAKDLVIERGENASLWTPEGRRYVDLGGASHGVANLGHNHPRIVDAIRQQAATLTHVAQTVPTPARSQMLERLHRMLPPGLSKTFLANSGTEAVEAALKLAVAATGRSRFVAAQGAFHGRSLGALSATHRPQYRAPFANLLQDVAFTPFNDVEALADTIDDWTAAIILEPVQGEGGVTVADPGYLAAARQLAHDHGALLILDEVQTGLGRTGTDFAFQHSGVVPDILTLGKSLAGGVPIGACTTTTAVADALPLGGHGSTFGGAPLACAAAAATLDVLCQERLGARAARMGTSFCDRLRERDLPAVREVRGQGLMIGIDLRMRTGATLAALQEAGFLALAAGSTVVRLLPPLTIPESDLDAAAEVLVDLLAIPPATPSSSTTSGAPAASTVAAA